MEKKTKKINLTVSLDVPSNVTPDKIVDEITKIVSNINPKEDLIKRRKLDEIKVAFTDKGSIGLSNPSGGYECKLWEKATCWIPNEKLDLVSNPILERIKIDLKEELVSQPIIEKIEKNLKEELVPRIILKEADIKKT